MRPAGRYLSFLFAALLGIVHAAPNSAEQAAQAFFDAVRDKQYHTAYDFLSASIRRDVSFEAFRSGAERVQSFKVLKQEVVDREANLVKFNVRAQLRVRHDGRLYLAEYAGKADVVLEKGRWRVLSIDLKAVAQKALGRDGTVDYGTSPRR